MYPVIAVLPVRGSSQVGFSIIVAVMVDMVDEQVVGGVENLAVHLNMLPFSIAEMDAPAGIKSISRLNGVPFVFA